MKYSRPTIHALRMTALQAEIVSQRQQNNPTKMTRITYPIWHCLGDSVFRLLAISLVQLSW